MSLNFIIKRRLHSFGLQIQKNWNLSSPSIKLVSLPCFLPQELLPSRAQSPRLETLGVTPEGPLTPSQFDQLLLILLLWNPLYNPPLPSSALHKSLELIYNTEVTH